MALSSVNLAISEEFWLAKAKESRETQEKIRSQIAAHEKANEGYFEQGIQLLRLASRAYDLCRVRNLSEKKASLNILVSNFTVQGRNIVATYKRPFDIVVEGSHCPNWLPGWDSNCPGRIFEGGSISFPCLRS